jgi:hypothetical protein
MAGEFGVGFANRGLGEGQLLYLSRHTECGEAARAPSPHPCLMFAHAVAPSRPVVPEIEGVGGREVED